MRTIAQELGDEIAWREVNILEKLDYAVFSLPRFFASLVRKSYLNHRGRKKSIVKPRYVQRGLTEPFKGL